MTKERFINLSIDLEQKMQAYDHENENPYRIHVSCRISHSWCAVIENRKEHCYII